MTWISSQSMTENFYHYVMNALVERFNTLFKRNQKVHFDASYSKYLLYNLPHNESKVCLTLLHMGESLSLLGVKLVRNMFKCLNVFI